MEVSKLTICRQDVVVVSDKEPQHKEEPRSKKKPKLKLKCVRKVQLTTKTVDRVVPNCYRQRCRRAHYYRRKTAKNIKYRKTEDSVSQDVQSRTRKRQNLSVKRDILCSPITVESSNGTYDKISSCSLNIVSSDSDELEDLIKLTRQRMKNENETCNNNNNKIFNKWPSATAVPDFCQYNPPNVNASDNTIQTMENTVIQHNIPIPSPPISPETAPIFMNRNDRNVEEALLNNSSRHNSKDIVSPKSLSPMSQDSNGTLSPLYVISGKVFMEHYLNTSII